MSTTKFVQGVTGHIMVGQNPGMPPPPHSFLFFYSHSPLHSPVARPAGHIFADSRGGASHELNYQPTGRGLNSSFGKQHDYTCCYQTGAYRAKLAYLISLRHNEKFELLGGMTVNQVSTLRSHYLLCFNYLLTPSTSLSITHSEQLVVILRRAMRLRSAI
jgi:hypothetical protein